MFGSTILEIAIGLIFIYLILSLICTSVNEFIAQYLNLRAEVLYDSIHNLFTGPDAARMAEDIYGHAVILGLRHKTASDPDGRLPSYIPASAFSLAVTDLLGLKEPIGLSTSVDPLLFHHVVDESKALYEDGVLAPLKPLINAANGSLDQARLNIEKWYDDAMQRALGWFKRRTQILTFCVSLGIAAIANADTLMILDKLWANPVQRTQIEAVAKNINAGTHATDASQLDKTTKDAALGLVGWQPASAKSDPRRLPDDWQGWVLKVFGLAITAFAGALGAPFWFDTLNKVMNIRSAGTSPDEKPTNDGKPAAVKNRVHSSDSDSAENSSNQSDDQKESSNGE